MILYEREKKDVPEEESRNWPKGAVKSSHEFSDKDKRTVVDRAYYDNEDLAYLFQLRRNELTFQQGMDPEKAIIQAKEELLSIVYPNVDLIHFKENNPNMPDKCCRAIYSYSLASIATFHIVHGEALKFFNLSTSGDEELNEWDDPKWGWDLTRPEEGFPCINLRPNGCIYHKHPQIKKPVRCFYFPYFKSNVDAIPSCSYSFSPDSVLPNRMIRTGTCNRCMG